MSFLHPEFLYYMLPPLTILFALLLTQKEAQLHFFSDEVISKLRVSANILTLKARNALFFLMGFFIILALAHPVINEGEVEVKAKSADIMIAMDISDSMLAEDVYPNRLKFAKQKAMELLKIAPNERIGVIAFAKNSYLVSPLSFDHSAVGFLLRQLDTSSITEKGTDFLSLLEVVNNSQEAKKYLLILSDGGDESDFSKELAYAKEKNIVVFVLGIGSLNGAPIKREDGNFIKHKGEIIISKLNENIADLATKSGGVYIESVKSDDDIKAMLEEIERLGKEKELKSEKVQRYIPLFYYPLGIALLLLLIATSSMTKRQTVQLPSVFVLFALLFATPHAEAGLLDFMELRDAKNAYENGAYEKASKLYTQHAQRTSNGQSYYNAGNALYKQEKYEEAINSYEKATLGNEKERAKNFANLGNSYVKMANEESLNKAIEAYNASLKLEEDKEVRENLEEVQKLLEKQKQEQNKEDKQEQNKEQEKKEGEENRDSQESQNSQDSNSSKEKNEKKQNENETPKEKEKQDTNETKSEQQKEESQAPKVEDSNATKEANSKNTTESKMSDPEEQKWLEQLNMEQNTYMYMLNDQKSQKENSDEKPW